MKKIIMVAIIAIGANFANAQWTKTNGPYGGGVINCFVSSGTNIFAGTNGGVFLSTNNGSNWTVVNNGLTNTTVWSLAISGTNIFAGTSGGGVWKRPLSEMGIGPMQITYPKLTLNTSNINAGQSITITGSSFTNNGKATINISGAGGFSQNNTLTANGTGGFTYSFATNTSMAAGVYNVQATDNISGKSTLSKSLIINVPASTNNIQITSPTKGLSFATNANIRVEWRDIMIAGNSYPLNGAKRGYKYTLEYSNNGGAWQNITTIQGEAYKNSTVNLNTTVVIGTASNSIVIRIKDDYKPTNTQTSPAFSVYPAVASNIKVDLQWDYSWPANHSTAPIGIAADGVARIYLNLHKINATGADIQSVSLTVSDGYTDDDYTTRGKVKVATQTNTYSTEGNNITTTTATNNTSGNTNYVFWYVAPNDFARGGSSGDDKNAERNVNADFTITYVGGATEAYTQKIIIVRPPLMMVHGLAGSPDSWSKFHHTGDQFFSTYDFMYDPLFKYEFAVRIDPSASFNTNAFNLVVPNNLVLFENTFQGVVDGIRTKGYATNRVDYVAHSMGGCVLRQVINLFYNAFNVTGDYSVSKYKNYEKGFVNKVITIDTPHNSSPLADLINIHVSQADWSTRFMLNDVYCLSEKSKSFIKEVATTFPPRFEASDAVKDLRVNGGVNMGSTNIPIHFIAGRTFGNQQYLNADVWNAIYTQHPYLVNMLDVLYEINRGLEKDLVKKAALQELKYLGNAEKAAKFLDLWVSWLAGTPEFLVNSDVIVPFSSQIAGLSEHASNVTVFDGLQYSHTTITDDLAVGDRVLELLNTPISSNLFKSPIPATQGIMVYNGDNNMQTNKNTPSLMSRGDSIILYSALDTTKIEILNPTNSSVLYGDSSVIIKLHVKDTNNLQYVKVYFQGESYITSSKSDYIEYNIQINNAFIGHQILIATAVYDLKDTTKFLYDTVGVNVTIDGSPISFSANPEVNFLTIGQVVQPTYQVVYPTFVANVTNDNPNLAIAINNQTIIKMDSASHGFKGIMNGETFAVVSYLGIADTIYFVVGGDTNIVNQAVPVAMWEASSQKVCAGSTIIFTDTSSYYPTNWSWDFPGGTPSTAFVPNPSVVYNKAGSYDVELIVSNIKGADTLTLKNYIVVDSLPQGTIIHTDASSCNASDGSATVNVSGGTSPYTYLWTPSGQTTKTAVGLAIDTFVVSVTDINGCTFSDTAIVGCYTAVAQYSLQNEFIVYPNPTTGKVNLEISQFENLKMKSIEVYNMYGAKVYSEKINLNSQTCSERSRTINLDVPDGMYFLHLQTEQGTAVKKLVIQK